MSSRVAQLFVIAFLLAASPAPRAIQSPTRAEPAATAPTPATAPSLSPTPKAVARQAEEGRPSFRNYVPREFALNTQNWAMVQDARGVLYVGTNSGVAEFDGVSWRLIEVGANLLGRSLALAPDGTVF